MLGIRNSQLGETRHEEWAEWTATRDEIDLGLMLSSLVLVFVLLFVDWPLPARLTP